MKDTQSSRYDYAVFLSIAFSYKSSGGKIDFSGRLFFSNTELIKSMQQPTAVHGYQMIYLFVAQV